MNEREKKLPGLNGVAKPLRHYWDKGREKLRGGSGSIASLSLSPLCQTCLSSFSFPLGLGD